MLFTFVGWDRRACASLFDTLRVIGPSEVKAKMEALRVLGVRMDMQERSQLVRAGEKLGQERRESGGPWRSKNRPPEICLRKRSQEERFVGYRRDVHSGAICTRSARGLC